MFRSVYLFISFLFFYQGGVPQSAHRFDIIIDEIFPDPSPIVGLPNAEFIELKNLSSRAIDLKGWQIRNNDQGATIRNECILEPDSFVIVCSSSSQNAYQNFGKTIGVSGIPSLDNDGMSLSLLDPSGNLIHAITYDKIWYRNEMKMEGGWSLEMIDPQNPCGGGSNWIASVDALGGTPGRVNSVNDHNPDTSGPELISTICTDPYQIELLFNEPLDSATAADSRHFAISQIGFPASVEAQSPLFDRVKLFLPSPLDSTIVYQVSVQGVDDCAGNPMDHEMTKPVSLPRHGSPLDLVINEILFNPVPNGYDYVEIYNRSAKTIDIRQWALANRKTNGSLDNIRRLSIDAFPVFPGEYMAFSENTMWVSQHYLVKNPDQLIQLESLPSLPDDEGDLVLLNEEGIVIDEVAYQHHWHYPLLANEEGVSLERLNVDLPTQKPDNWSSAASLAGFGTPTYKNSQYRENLAAGSNLINVSPRVFSPDNDGYEDFCFVQYRFAEAGYIGNVTIFNSSGIPVRYLARSVSFTREGSLRWDGLDENLHRLPMGIYIVYSEIFNLKGEVGQFKSAITIAGRLN